MEEFTEGGLDIELSTQLAVGLQDSALVNYVSFPQGNFPLSYGQKTDTNADVRVSLRGACANGK